MRSIQLFFASALSLLLTTTAHAQVDQKSELFLTLKANDSLLFDIGFNTCDMDQSAALLTEDLEFYHDQGGITNSKEEFVQVMKSGICSGGEYTSCRELVEGSLEVFPLYQNGQLDGAIQNGVHKFYQRKGDGPERAGSTARFTHLWLITDEGWKIKRVLSFDHRPPDSE
ncbi:nuclear transport factor 2 family protein [Aureitalea marina]|uniref:DUF4440 domain-containing protein n=1 Tax=Aureitalea marina TaxID=930804 RepID=A0A2S7KPV9_9FLAO|nr:nuclear transport factor 2 family protein [Aureitalea marina]PQB04662.1 hypothetical protein BST85_06955 [Aureitalea marina]